MKHSRSVTIEDLVQAIQDIARDDDEVVAVLEHMLRTRRIVRPAIEAAAA
jgi:hypothetical protein